VNNTSLVWFRNDLRVTDNPALNAAAENGSVVAVFLISDQQWTEHYVAARRLGFLKGCLQDLEKQLQTLNIPLLIEHAASFAEAPEVLLKVADAWHCRRLDCNAEYPLNEQRRDRCVASACDSAGLSFSLHHGGVVVPPGSVNTATGQPYTVFTPFKRRWLSILNPDDWSPQSAPTPQAKISHDSSSQLQNSETQSQRLLGLLPDHSDESWPAGGKEAQRRLEIFLARKATGYQQQRDIPSENGTSGLSPYLSIGAISARTCLAAARQMNDQQLNVKPGGRPGLDTWISELVWREFYRHVTASFPHISTGAAFRRETDQLEWRQDTEAFERWCQGMTGYPLVDAGMRQLNNTGWMHNRLRMVTAMFLSKHLLLDWRLGERYFMENLIDGDFAANNGGWQWSASTGTDSVPYFRIFNPTSQAKKFDARSEFIRRWVPEIDGLTFESATSYPAPMVDHAIARQRALDFFKRS
jgi:deoxyribodipyrimidine photo-lyase